MVKVVLSSILSSLAYLAAHICTTTAAPVDQSNSQKHLIERQGFGPLQQAPFFAPPRPFGGHSSGRFHNTLFPFPGAPTATPVVSSGPTAASHTIAASSSPPLQTPIAVISTTPIIASTSSAGISVNSSARAASTSVAVQSTTPSEVPAPSSKTDSASGHEFQLSFVNNLPSPNVHAYITGLDHGGRVFMLTSDGSFYYPTTSQTTPQLISAAVAIPLASVSSVVVPEYVSSARVWLADGELQFSVVDTSNGPGLVEPTAVNPEDASHDVNWGFVEFTFNAQVGLFADLSYVDFVGIPLGLELQTKTNGNQTALGMPRHAVKKVCNLLKAKGTKDGQPWGDLCVSDSAGKVLRVISPSTLISNQADAFADYWDNYLSSAYNMYTTNPLTFNTQNSAGDIACTSSSNSFHCGSSGGNFAKPSASDIFGCNTGPFAISQNSSPGTAAIVPRLCAALHRCTLTRTPGGNVQPSLAPADYYRGQVCNWYSAMVHKVELDGKGYAFPYDDVSPTTADDTAGIVADLQPDVLVVTIGGPK